MKKIKRISTAGTIICLISVILYIIVALVMHFQILGLFAEFAGDSMGKLEQVDSNSPSAGFEVIGYLAGGALGFLGGLFSFLLILFLGFLALYQIPAIVAGFVANSRYKKGYDRLECIRSYKTDGFIKAIMNGAVLVIVLLMTAGEIGNLSVSDIVILPGLVWNYIIVFILSIYQIKKIKTEENADKSEDFLSADK